MNKPYATTESRARPSLAVRLTRLSLNRPVTVLVLFVTIIVVGFVATVGIPLELFPRGYEAQHLNVYVPWYNAPTREVMEKVTYPMEEELSTIRGLDGLNSWTDTGGARAFMSFKQGTDMDIAYREVRDRMERAKALFPEDADRYYIWKHDPSGMPVAMIGLVIDSDILDYYDLVEKKVVLPLSRIDGVARVFKDGLLEKEILIEIDKQKAEANGLNLYQMAQDLRGDNFTLASGNVRDADKKFILRSVATYRSIEELENRMLTPTLRLKDVAEIKYEEPDKRFSVRVNGQQALALGIQKEGEANTVELCKEIRAQVARMQEDPQLQGIQMELFFDQGTMVLQSINNLISSGRIGGFFAALVLFLFLRRFRLTAIIALSIPVSMLIALVFMFFWGETLNILTILGLVICVGLLVDNSVVVAENIHRHYRDGLDRRQACVQGAGEIALAITMATLTTIVVFLPVALVEGQGQFFLLRLAMPISVSLVASLAVALVFIPLCVYLTLPRNGRSTTSSRLQRIHQWLDHRLRQFYQAGLGRLNHFYNHGLAFFLHRHRMDLVILLAAVFGVTWWLAVPKVKFVDTQEEDETGFYLSVQMSSEYDFAATREYFREAERILEGMVDELGLKWYLIVHFERGGRIEGWMDEDREDRPLAKKAVELLAEALPETPGVKLHFRQEDRQEDAKGRDVFGIRLQGNDPEVLKEWADELEPLFLSVEGVLGKRMNEEDSPNELALVMNRERMTSTGVNPEVVAGIIGYALRGQQLTKFHYQGREIPVRVRFEEEDRESLSQLKNFSVPTPSGDALPLSALTEVRMLKSPQGIFRRDKKVTHSLTLELDPEKAESAKQALIRYQRLIQLPEGVSFDTSTFSERNEDLENLKFAGVLSVLFIYLLMGFLFESFILPLSIILTIPLAGIGVVWIHWIMGKDLDFLGVVGIILLIGVVVNNGIVLIDYVNRLRHQGMERNQAILRAADRRFRPILMTAMTTIIGMIPLAVSKPSTLGLSYKSFGLTLIGGMTTATLLTLLVVPVFYTFFDDARILVGGSLKRMLGGTGVPTANEISVPATARNR